MLIRILCGFLLTFTFLWASPTDSLQKDSVVITKKNVPIDLEQWYAKWHKIQLCDSNNIELYKFIKRWYRTPYCFGGASKRGTDCSGFTMVLADSLFKIKLNRVAGDQLKQCIRPVKRQELQEGDLVFFTIGQRYWISHVGIYLKDHKFAHAACIGGVIISDLREPYYNTWFFKGGRIEKMTEPHFDPSIHQVVIPKQNNEPVLKPAESL